MGRRTNLEKEIKAATALQRPAPPDHLTDDEAEVWVKIVNRMTADWFPDEVHDLLVCHCVNVIESRRVKQWMQNLVEDETIDMNDPGPQGQYHKLNERFLKLTGSLSSTGTKLRINISSQRSSDDKKPIVRSTNPHEFTGEEDDAS